MVVEGALPPMIWSGWRPTLLLPRAIVESIAPAQRRLLLLHELLHVRRGDHLVRWFAVAVLALYWWNPAAWWAVRRLQDAEEECCDANVLCFQPHQFETYGEALLAVSEFVSCGSLPAAAVSVGVERKSHLKRRMTMILKGSRWAKLTKAPLAAVLASAVIVVTVSLTVAANQTEPPIETNSRAQAPLSTSQAKSGQPSEAAGHPATAAKTSMLEPAKRLRAVETTPPADRLPAWMTAQPVVSSGDDEWHNLLEDRYNAALKSLHAHVARIEVDANIPTTPVVAAARTLLDAELAITATADTVGVYQRYAEFLRYFDDLIGKHWEAQTVGADEFNAVHEARLDAEIKLRRHRVRPAPPAWLTAKALEPASGDDELRKLLMERYNSALKALHAQLARIENESNVRITPVLAAARTLRDDEDAVAAPGDTRGAYQHYGEFMAYFDDFISRRMGTKTIAADEINALVDACRKAEQMRRNFSGQKSPARSTPSITERTKSLPAAQAAAAASEPLPGLLKAKPLEPVPLDSELQKLLKERYNAALEYLRRSYRRFHAMEWTPENVLDAARRVVDAELALSAAPAAETGVRKRYLELAKLVDAQAQKMAASGQMRQEDADAAHEARLDAEIKLLQARSVSSTNPRVDTKAGSISRLALQSLETRIRIAEAEVAAARAAVEQCQAELKRALANFKYRQLQFDRLQALRKQNAVSEGGMEDATRAHDEAAASVDAAKASVQAAIAQVAIKDGQLQQARLELDNAKAVGAK